MNKYQDDKILKWASKVSGKPIKRWPASKAGPMGGCGGGCNTPYPRIGIFVLIGKIGILAGKIGIMTGR